MAPVAGRSVTQRDVDTGKTFSIVFAVIAFLVVVICIVWGYFIPKWRFKYGRPSSTRFNCVDGAAKFGLSAPQAAQNNLPRFPSHPGIRGLHKAPSMPIDNPRTESPFGNDPRNIEFAHLDDFTAPYATPTHRKFSSTRKRPTHDYELPQTPGTLSQLAMTDSLHDLGLEGHDESGSKRPMAAPPLVRCLADPNFLFEKLDQLDSPKTSRGCDESCLSESASRPDMKGSDTRRMDTTIQTAGEAKSKVTEASEGGDLGRSSGRSSSAKDIVEPAIAVPEPIHRYPAGTIRDRGGGYSRGVRFIPPTEVSLQRRLDPLTEPLASTARKKAGSPALNTPPSSPSLPIHNPALIPTPLRVRRAAAASPTPADIHEKRKSSSESSMALSLGKLVPFSLQKSIKGKRKIRKSIGLPRPKRGATAAKPELTRIKRSSWKSSSVYSRDTKGMSIPPSPKWAPGMDQESEKGLPLDEPSVGRADSMDRVRRKIDDWNLPTGGLELPVPPLFDTQSDVGPKNLRFVVEKENPSPVSTGAKGDVPTSFGLTMPVPKVYVGRSSDDVFGSGENAQNSGQVLRKARYMEMISSKSNWSRCYGRTAPGGAEWI